MDIITGSRLTNIKLVGNEYVLRVMDVFGVWFVKAKEERLSDILKIELASRPIDFGQGMEPKPSTVFDKKGL
jgi:hypothetical protein